VFACQSISGTGANFLGATLLQSFYRPGAVILVSKPTWANHHAMFSGVGLKVQEYAYWDKQSLALDLDGMLRDIRNAPDGSIVLLHVCAHNPTGVDPTKEQWGKIADAIKEKGHFPFFDGAYQGFASGDLDADAWSVRYFVERGFELLACQSFAKNFGIYGERAGCLTIVAKDADAAKRVGTQLSKIVRRCYSNPPTFGARVVSTVLNNAELYAEWRNDLKTMAGRINGMRLQLRSILEELKTPGSWAHITTQIGMFSFTGLNEKQVQAMKGDFHIYLTDNGRISMAGLNSANVRYFAESVDWVVRNV